jgi:uncharacterized protein YbjT (DUF2867 family)
MQTDSRTALLLGANGLIGNYLLFKLLQSERYSRVRILVRRPLHYSHPKLDERVVDFDHLTPDDVRADDVYCCLGTTIGKAGSQEAFRKVDYAYPLAVGQLARATGAHQYLLVSSVGADAGSRIFYSRTKGEIEQAIQQLGYPSVHILRPSMLRGKRKEFRLGEEVGKVLDLILTPVWWLVRPLRKYQGIEAAKVAQALLTLASQDAPGVHVHESDALQRY